VGLGLALLLRLAGPPAIRSHAGDFIRGFVLAVVLLVSATWLCFRLIRAT
jgi:hypothetical protein